MSIVASQSRARDRRLAGPVADGLSGASHSIPFQKDIRSASGNPADWDVPSPVALRPRLTPGLL